MCVQLASDPPGGSSWLEEVVDEGVPGGPEGGRGAASVGLGRNSREVRGAERGSECM